MIASSSVGKILKIRSSDRVEMKVWKNFQGSLKTREGGGEEAFRQGVCVEAPVGGDPGGGFCVKGSAGLEGYERVA